MLPRYWGSRALTQSIALGATAFVFAVVCWAGTSNAASRKGPFVGAATARSFYRNPLRRIRQLFASRIDEGVDYHGSGPVTALGPAIVTAVDRGNSIFWSNVDGNVVVVKMQTGPLEGISIYAAENCTPSRGLHVGEKVTASTALCNLHNSFPYLEIGFAQPNNSGIPAAWNVYRNVPDGSKTAYGVDFNHLLGDLGAPRGNTNPGHLSYHPWVTVGTLPRGFPRF